MEQKLDMKSEYKHIMMTNHEMNTLKLQKRINAVDAKNICNLDLETENT